MLLHMISGRLVDHSLEFLFCAWPSGRNLALWTKYAFQIRPQPRPNLSVRLSALARRFQTNTRVPALGKDSQLAPNATRLRPDRARIAKAAPRGARTRQVCL